MDYSLQGSSLHRILQARILERVAISLSWGSSWPRVSHIASRLFTIWYPKTLPRNPLPQGIFLTQGVNPGLLDFRQTLKLLSHQEISRPSPRSPQMPLISTKILWHRPRQSLVRGEWAWRTRQCSSLGYRTWFISAQLSLDSSLCWGGDSTTQGWNFSPFPS